MQHINNNKTALLTKITLSRKKLDICNKKV